MITIQTIKNIIKEIKEYFDTNHDATDIPMMRYPPGQEDKRKNFVNPFSKYNSHNSRIRFRRR